MKTSSYLGWTEITDSNQKQSSITNNLGNLDYAGYLLAEDWGNTHREHFESLEQTFEFDKVSMKVLSIYDTDEAPERCFQFNTKGSLCVKYLTDSDDFHTYVSTLVKTKENSNEQDSLIFPRFSTDAYKSGGALGDQILGLTINNDADDLEDLQTIIIFQHDSIIEQVDGCQFVPGSPQCIYWDLKSNDWSNLGCEVTSHTDTEVVCTCNHLTNFGLMLDWSGQADSQDPVLSALSTFLLIISMISLILTEVLLFLNKKDTRNLLRRTAESNRNICLFIAQLCFVAFVGSNKSFSCGICEAMGAVTHFAWLAFFSWMFVEGYFFYTALVIVFEMTRKRLWLFYVLTYGVSLIIDSENTVNSCWLHSYAIIAVLVPVGLVVAFNIGITILAVKVADKAGRRREQKSKQRIISTFRNTILISLLLGLTWTIGFLPFSVAQQYITVILNASMGIYILAYSILANTKVRTDIKERVTEMMTRSTAPQPSPTTERTQQEVNKPITIHSNSNSFSRNSFSDTKL